MQVQVKAGNLVGICEGANAHDLFKQISLFQETFEDSKCGLCGSENLQYTHRVVEANDFYELVCKEKTCRAKLRFGTSKEDKKMYPKRFKTDNKGKAVKDEQNKGVPLGKNKNGWVKWNFDTKQEE